MIKAKCRFDQTGGTGGCFGMTNHGFDGAQGTFVTIGTGFFKYPVQGLELHFIADPGAGAVGFDQSVGGGIDTGIFIRRAQSPDLAFNAGRVDALRFTVA